MEKDFIMGKRVYFEDEVTTVRKRKGWIEIDTDFTQIYHCMKRIAPYINSATTWKLLFWLLSDATNKNNGISVSKEVYEGFNKYLRESCDKCEVTYRTFQNCIAELHTSKALTKVGRGQYYFNPHIFWKDEKANREQFIIDEAKEKKCISHNPNQPIENTITNTPTI